MDSDRRAVNPGSIEIVLMTTPDRAPDSPAGDSLATLTRPGDAAGNAEPTHEVGAMFDRIAPVYDGMNAVISGFQEPRWRRKRSRRQACGEVAAIDVATGTGKLARSLADRVGPFGRVVGVDVSAGMLERARVAGSDAPWLEFMVGDALSLPVDDGTFDAATIAFGMRNLPDYERGFAEMAWSCGPADGRLPRDRPAAVAGRAGWTAVVRAGRSAHRANRRPGRGVSLPRLERPGLPTTGGGP
jgi:SAM-dependent methyltransferase